MPESASPASWSLFVKLTHWAVAALVVVDLFNDSGWWHRAFGYTALLLVLLRVVYGCVGNESPARLWWPGVKQVKQHLLEVKHGHVASVQGHNPLGLWAVYAMWTLIAGLAFSGWLSRTDALWGEDWPVELHGYLALALQALVVLHVLAVLVMSRLQGPNLIRRMIGLK